MAGPPMISVLMTLAVLSAESCAASSAFFWALELAVPEPIRRTDLEQSPVDSKLT